MRIIKQGKKFRKTYEFTCEKCGCVYEISKNEFMHEEGDGPYRPGYDYYECPCCEKRNTRYKEKEIEI